MRRKEEYLYIRHVKTLDKKLAPRSFSFTEQDFSTATEQQGDPRRPRYPLLKRPDPKILYSHPVHPFRSLSTLVQSGVGRSLSWLSPLSLGQSLPFFLAPPSSPSRLSLHSARLLYFSPFALLWPLFSLLFASTPSFVPVPLPFLLTLPSLSLDPSPLLLFFTRPSPPPSSCNPPTPCALPLPLMAFPRATGKHSRLIWNRDRNIASSGPLELAATKGLTRLLFWPPRCVLFEQLVFS